MPNKDSYLLVDFWVRTAREVVIGALIVIIVLIATGSLFLWLRAVIYLIFAG